MSAALSTDSLRRQLPEGFPTLKPRDPSSHKGDYGRTVLVGGSVGLAGAVAMAGMAALRSGAGLVSLLVPRDCWAVVAGFHPAYMCHPLDRDGEGRWTPSSEAILDEMLERADCVAIGPGLGNAPAAKELAIRLYRKLQRPLVVDADGLNALATRPDPLARPAGPRILTPHPGEFARLSGQRLATRDEQESLARQLAAQHGCVLVLKGHRTLVTNGSDSFHNPTGNPGMATGGTGDVLTGVLTALVGQGLSVWDAARLGVLIHGLAGDLAAEVLGQVAMTAVDVLEYLPQAFRRLAAVGASSASPVPPRELPE